MRDEVTGGVREDREVSEPDTDAGARENSGSASDAGSTPPVAFHLLDGDADPDLFEGEYGPAGGALCSPAAPLTPQSRSGPVQTEFLIRLADALNTTLDLKTMLARTAELVRAVIDYRIFAILLINDRTNDLRMRFQVGHPPEIARMRFKMGEGVVGQVALTRQPQLINDVTRSKDYVMTNENVCSELAVPLIVKNRVIGVIDIESEQLNYFRPEHLHLLTLTASRVSQAIENARLYTRVARQAQTLTVLNEISRELTSILELDVLFTRIGELLKRIVDFQFFTIWILNERTGHLESRFATRFGEHIEVHETLPVDRGLVGLAISEQRLVTAPDVRRDGRYYQINRETRAELIVPLVYKNRVIGVLDLEHTRMHSFNEDHERAMTTLAAQVAISIENARLYQRVTQQEQRLEQDLSMAREVQLRLLPQRLPEHQNAEFAARFLPARTIGGDLYDFIRYDPRHTAIALGDVSGKAAPAALYAALVSGIMRAAGGRSPAPPAMLSLLNDALQERHLASQYVAMVYALWDDETRMLHVANAGATQPLICRAGKVETVAAEGFPLGMFPDVEYQELALAFAPGDTVVFFSDGIADAQNHRGEMFGNDRLLEVVSSCARKPAAGMADSILAAVGRFQGGLERFDDETVVVLRIR